MDGGTKGRGLGAFLLMDALNRILFATQAMAIHAVVVDARDEAAASFYEGYGCITFPDESRRLLIPMETIGQLVVSPLIQSPPR